MNKKRTGSIIVFTMISLFMFADSPGNPDGTETSDFYKIDIDLTSDEQKWLEEHKTIRVGGPKSFPPFHSYNEEGIPMGIASDYINILFENLGSKIDTQANLPWPEVLERTKTKQLDLIACSAKSADREEFLLFTEPHLSFPLIIISRNDSPFIGGLKDLHNLKVALLEKNIISDWLKRDNIEVIPYMAGSPLDALEAVSVGYADAFIGNLASCSFLISQNGLTNLKIAAPTEYGYYNLYIAVRKDWPELVSILNKGLAAITPRQRSEIRNEWLSIKYEYGISYMDIIKSILIVIGIASIILLIILRWNRRLMREINIRKKAEHELKEACANINTLTGLLPICASCKKIRDDKGYWKQIEGYFEEHSDVSFTHGLCPNCLEKIYGDKDWYNKGQNNK